MKREHNQGESNGELGGSREVSDSFEREYNTGDESNVDLGRSRECRSSLQGKDSSD